MLFSNSGIANHINANFEPVWHEARTVPLVTIDFGNGNIVNRTMQGNVATYICFADGRVMDVLPGLYDADSFKRALEQVQQDWTKLNARPSSERASAVRAYHNSSLHKLPVLEIGLPVAAMISGKLRAAEGSNRKNISAWTELYQDSIANEVVWRRTAHEILSDMAPPLPHVINKRIYKDVLHTDLDDPYLGMGPSLFVSYPFEK